MGNGQSERFNNSDEEYIDDYDYTLKKQWHTSWHDREVADIPNVNLLLLFMTG